ncbi:MAG: acyl-CoA dehydratase activase [Candidatus Thermoplasmatota archaeon]|nr:acyl-CoA dehydratase activase [Candidatus Thermoplasmatota archaeon]
MFAGIDVGASATKCMIIDEGKNELSSAVKRTGMSLRKVADEVYKEALSGAGLELDGIKVVATGFGRKNVDFADSIRTEISCHCKGCYHHFPRALTIVDIGGQDTKLIRTNVEGKIIDFKMNRKCAAGTGAFLEEIARRMDVPLEEMNGIALSSEREIEIGSYCTVFTATEILSKIREGEKQEDIVRGVFGSVIKRIQEMNPLIGDVVLTGGVVAHNEILFDLLEEALGREVLKPPKPQFTGAFGAALYAMM